MQQAKLAAKISMPEWFSNNVQIYYAQFNNCERDEIAIWFTKKIDDINEMNYFAANFGPRNLYEELDGVFSSSKYFEQIKYKHGHRLDKNYYIFAVYLKCTDILKQKFNTVPVTSIYFSLFRSNEFGYDRTNKNYILEKFFSKIFHIPELPNHTRQLLDKVEDAIFNS